jgi:large-conductance mechanosensitive channel
MQKRAIKLKRRREIDWSPQKVAKYSSIINAQQSNFMTGTKVLLPLSAGGIGLLVGVSNSFSFSSIYQIIAFACSILGFSMTILFIIGIYGCKFDLLDIKEQLFINNNTEQKDTLIKKKDKRNKEHSYFSAWIASAFMFAIISMAIFSGISIYEKYNSTKEKNNMKSVQVVNEKSNYTH